jgi:uncharacterized protein
MFPLGSVVFPYTAVPLRVFEPRYQHLLDDVLASDRRFGSVLIERGPEVGGGDQRFDVGALVTVTGVSRLPQEGHRLVVVTGSGRIRVTRWLPDDPYPQAEVERYEDEAETVPDGLVDEIRGGIRRVLALASELGADTGPITAELADDPLVASYQAAALTPVTPLDAHRLLAAPGPATRLRACGEMLDESGRMLTRRLQEG